MVLALAGLLAGEIGVMHVLQSLGQDMDPAQMAELVQPLIAFGRACEVGLEQQHDDPKSERERVLDDPHRFGKRWIREQHVAVSRPFGHLEEVEYRRIGAAAIFYVAGVHDEPPRRMAITRLPMPQNGSQTLMRSASNGSCVNSGSSAIGGVSNLSIRGRPANGQKRGDFVWSCLGALRLSVSFG